MHFMLSQHLLYITITGSYVYIVYFTNANQLCVFKYMCTCVHAYHDNTSGVVVVVVVVVVVSDCCTLPW